MCVDESGGLINVLMLMLAIIHSISSSTLFLRATLLVLFLVSLLSSVSSSSSSFLSSSFLPCTLAVPLQILRKCVSFAGMCITWLIAVFAFVYILVRVCFYMRFCMCVCVRLCMRVLAHVGLCVMCVCGGVQMAGKGSETNSMGTLRTK